MKPVEEIAREIVNKHVVEPAIFPERMVADLATALRAERERAEKAEAERDEARAAMAPFAAQLIDIGVDETDDDTFRVMSRDYARAPRLRVGDFRRLRDAPNILATARNSALEEAAEVAGEELTAYDEEGNDGEVWVVRKIVDAILALRAKEPDHE